MSDPPQSFLNVPLLPVDSPQSQSKNTLSKREDHSFLRDGQRLYCADPGPTIDSRMVIVDLEPNVFPLHADIKTSIQKLLQGWY